MRCRICKTESGVRKHHGTRGGQRLEVDLCEVCHMVDYPEFTVLADDKGVSEEESPVARSANLVLTMDGLQPT